MAPPRIIIALAVIVFAIAVPSTAFADRTVRGVVRDHETGLPIAGALVTIGIGEATTDENGAFSVSDIPFGRIDVLVIAENYATYFGSARMGQVLAIRLESEANASEVIHVSGAAPTGPPLHLDTQAIRTQPGAGNDVLRALQSLPGAARTPFGLGGLALRGTAPRDTKVYLDGIEVPLLYHFGGIASFMPTAAVDEVTLEPGGASVRYGRGLGGVAIVTSRTGRADRWRVGGEVSLIHAGAVAEGPGPGRGSWLIAARRSYFDAILAAAQVELALAPRYADAQVRWESGDGRWMAILFGSDDKLRLIPADDSSGGLDTSRVKNFSYVSRFARLGLRYRAIRGATSIVIVPSLGIDNIDASANHNELDKGMHRTTLPFSLRGEVATAFLGGTLSVGIDTSVQGHWYGMINTPPPTPSNPVSSGVVERNLSTWASDIGAFVEQSWFFADDSIEIRPGLRGDRFGLSEQWTLDPRILINWRLPNAWTLTQSLGRYHAPPLVTDLDPIFMRTLPMLGSAATQVATTAKKIVGDDKELSATVYYQDLRQLPVDAVSGATPTSANGGTESGGLLGISRELVDTQFGSYSYREAIGTGHAYGLELIARRNVGRWTGWIAYTFARTYRENPIRDDGATHPYVLDQPHSFTLLGSTQLGKKWRLGGRVRYVTGNPLTPVAGAYRDAKGEYVAVDGELLSQRLPDFFQLDLRADRSWFKPWGLAGTINLYFDVQNVINRKNAEGVTYNGDYSVRSFTNGLPIFPSIGVEYIP